MRILAIRGENISSLRDKFEINFEKEPLASTGLFSISGPTGAGKSTVLDAMCLALYRTTPRLETAPSVGVTVPDGTNDTIPVKNAVNLMRRGAAFCWVEVVFEGADRQRYRSRWSVNRAHNNPAGTIQAPKAELYGSRVVGNTYVEDVLIANSVTEFTAAIGRTVGLTFEEFTRSVLLAQNEFTSFLKAPDHIRSEILEKLTGVDIFSKIGTQVHIGAREAKECLAALVRQKNLLPVLTDEERQRKNEDMNALAGRIGSIEGLEAKTNTLRTLKTALATASEAHTTAERNHTSKNSETDKHARNVETLNAALERAKKEQSEAAPLIAEAHRIQGEKDTLDNQRGERSRQQAQLRAGVEQKETEKKRLELEKQNLERNQREILDWQQGNRHFQTWAENWVEHNGRFEAAAHLSTTMADAKRTLAEDETASQAKQLAIANAHEEEQLLRSALETLIQEKAALSENRNTLGNATQIAEESVRLADEKNGIKALMTFAQQGATITNELTENHQKLERLKNDVKVHTENVAEKAQKKTDAEKRWNEALERDLRHAQQNSKNATEMRAALVAGTPCPVCGSTEHPLVAENSAPPAHTAEASIQSSTESLKAQCDAATRNLNEASTLLIKTNADLQNAQKKFEELTANQKQLESQVVQSGHLWPMEAGREGSLKQELETLERKIQDNAQKREKVQKLENKITSLEKDLEQKKGKAQQLAVSKAALETEKAGIDGRLTTQRSALTRQDAELETVLRQLDGAHGGNSGWRQEWQASPREYHRKMGEKVTAWNAKAAQRDDQHNRLQQLETQLTEASNLLQERTQGANESAAALAQLSAAVAEKQQRLNTILNGLPLAEFERRIAESVAAAQASFQTAQDHNQRHIQELARLAGLLEQTSLNLKNARKACEEQQNIVRNDADHLNLPLAEQPEENWTQFVRSELVRLREEKEKFNRELRNDADNREKIKALDRQISELAPKAELWQQLDQLIGSSDGRVFRNQAHQLTLLVLFAHANHHLKSFAPRYELCSEGQGILIKDLDLGDQKRSVYSLSGGESFLVSLALAMGLASLSSNQIPVESLFIDEGFGSLDSETLKVALEALDRLQAQGRKVGVISHVPDMADRIGVQIQVKPDGEGRSRIIVPTL